MNFKWDLNLSHLIIIAPIITGVAIYLINDHEAIANLTTSVNEMKASTKANIEELKVNMNQQFNDVRNAIASIPDLRASQTQNERRIGSLEIDSRNFSTNIGDLTIRVGTLEGRQREQLRQPKGLHE